MSEPLTTEPAELRAGDSISWERDLPDHLPSDGWVLRYRVLWQAPPAKSFDASASGTVHRVDLSAAATASYPAGQATLVGWVEKDGTRITLLQTPLLVLPDLTSAASLDGRSDNQRGLAQARSALSDFVARGNAMTEEYEIAGRRMRFRSLQELQDLVAYYERQCARDDATVALQQGVVPGRIYTRF